MTIQELINQLEDMMLIYGNRIILTITDGESEYRVKNINGKQYAKYFEPGDNVAEVIINIYRKRRIKMTREEAMDMEIEALSAEPKIGEWTRSHIGTIAEGFYCSRCGKPGYKTDFCPNCGADMRGEEE